MEVLKDISQLTKGCLVTFIKNDKFHYYEFLLSLFYTFVIVKLKRL